MSGHYSTFLETGDLLVERRVNSGGGGGSRKSDRSTTSAAAAAAALAAFAASSGSGGSGSARGSSASATAALHSGNWPEQAMKSCISRLGGNGCWARYCACDACRPYARRGSNASCGSGHCCDDDLAPVTVTDEHLRVTYEVWGLRPSELPVKGTYIDSRIVAGFKYRVRYLGGSDQYHHSRLVFPEPVRLRSIGAGYGKRLTFDTRQLASSGGGSRPPCGHFWSDSCPEGFAFSLVALDVGQRFSLRGGRRADQELGRVAVTWVAPEPAECRLRVGASAVTARVAVAFKASVSLTTCRCMLGCHDYEDVPLTGLAWLERPAGPRAVARVTRIEGVRLPDMPELKLVPLND